MLLKCFYVATYIVKYINLDTIATGLYKDECAALSSAKDIVYLCVICMCEISSNTEENQ